MVLRFAVHAALGAGFLLIAASAHATRPGNGTLTPANDAAHPLLFTAGPFDAANYSNLFGLQPYTCDADNPCDVYELAVDLPPGHRRERPDDFIRIRLDWGAGGGDYDLLLLNEAGILLAHSTPAGEGARELLLRASHGARKLRVVTAPVTAGAQPVKGRVVLEALPDALRNDQLPYAAHGPAPRFQNYRPDQQGLGLFGGEATIDVNWKTGSVFYLGFLQTLRVRFDDTAAPPTAKWENKPGNLNSKFSSDPILVGDPDTGRIFAQQLILGEGQSLSEYSDDDGETWLPGGGGAVLRSGADHQSLGVGPYPKEGAGALIPHPLYPNAVYYCSQDIALAYCSRSDDGGVTFNAGVPLYTVDRCVGLHGHAKIAPDGTVYVPNKSCHPGGAPIFTNGEVAVVVSEDAGQTWQVRTVPGSTGNLFAKDPSAAVARDGTLYLAYSDAETRHLYVAVSKDKGQTWVNRHDVGAIAGVRWSEFPAAVAGDGERAAVAFFGSAFSGNEPPGHGDLLGGPMGAESFSADMSFQGRWYLYVAATYDGGKTWSVENATPGDPMQGPGGIGTGGNRNLYDFFDAAVDPQGRILIGYEDGCAGNCPQGGQNTFQDFAVIARQVGGPRMFAEFDALAAAQAVEPVAGVLPPSVPVNAQDPRAACTLPGVFVADAVGEAEAQPPHRDLAGFAIAEPADMPGKLVFTLKPALALPPAQGGAYFFLHFDTPDGARRYRLRLGADGNLVGYFDGGFTEDATGAQALALVADAGRALDPASGFQADGSVRFVLDKAAWGLATGDTLGAIMATTYVGPRGVNVLTEEAGYDVSYTLQGNDACGGRAATRAKEGSGLFLGAFAPAALLVLAALGWRRRGGR